MALSASRGRSESHDDHLEADETQPLLDSPSPQPLQLHSSKPAHGHGHGHGHGGGSGSGAAKRGAGHGAAGGARGPRTSGPPVRWYHNPTLRKIATIGAIMGVYSVGELVVALYYDSLVLLVDSLHNASDSLALAVAFWAESMKLRAGSQALTFGWRRTELLGGLYNGFFLLSMSLFVLLEAIPKLIAVESASDNGSIPFIVVASVGIFLNIIGSFLFSHGHSHGGGGHGHSHGGGSSHKARDADHHGHSHSSKAEASHHGHGAESDHGHGHSHGHDDCHGDGHSDGHSDDVVLDTPALPAAAAISGATPLRPLALTDHHHADHHHEEGGEEDVDDDDSEHGHGHGGGRDHNTWGLFIHFVGDVVTSLLVLGVGLIYHFFPLPEHPAHSPKHYWINYADPVSSILSVAIILLSAWPLVKSCSWILLQSTALDLSKIREDIRAIDGVVSVHELHIWELVDSLVIASVHVVVRDDLQTHVMVNRVKKVLHRYGVHSTTIQPEFLPAATTENATESAVTTEDCVFPEGSCVQDCHEERCCPPKRQAPTDIEIITDSGPVRRHNSIN